MNYVLRLCAFFSVCALAFPAVGAIIYRADFETEINTSSTSPINSGSISRLDDNCVSYDRQSYTPSAIQHVRRATSPARIGGHSLLQLVQKGCSYAVTMSNPDLRQKPRVGFIPKKTVIELFAGTEYWIAQSIYLPTSWQTETNSLNPDNLFQLFKEDNRNNGAHSFGIDVKQSEIQFTAWNTGAGATKVQYNIPIVKGEWVDYVLHVKLDKVEDGASGGFFSIYVDYPSNVNDPSVAVLTGTGINTEGDSHSLAFNLYKYAGYCLSAYQLNPTQCPYSTATGYPAATSNATNWTGQRSFYVDEVRVGDAASSLAEVAPHFDATAAPTVDPTIIGMNVGQPLEPSDDPVYFTTTGGDTSGVLSASVSDSVNSESVTGINSNATGGRFTLGTLSALSGGPVTVSVNYDASMQLNSETDLMTDIPGTWTKTNLYTPAAIDSSTSELVLANYGATQGVTLCNSTTSAGYIISPVISATAGQTIQVNLLAKRTGTTDLRMQLYDGTNISDARGTLGVGGTFARVLNNSGSAHAMTRTQVASDVDFITYSMTAATASYRLRLGPLTTTSGACANILQAQVWVAPTPVTMTYNTTLVKADTIAPSPSDCQISAIDTTTFNLGCSLDDNTGTFYSVISTSTTAPSLPQLKSGQDHTGSAALWAGSQAATSGTFTTPALDPYVQKCAYFAQTDAAVNDSTVVSAETCVAAEIPVVKKFIWSTANGNAIFCYNANTNTITPFTGNMAITITDGDYFTPGDNEKELAYAPTVPFVSGEAEMLEDDLSAGSINALLTGDQGYNFWATDGTCRADNAIQLIAE